MILFEGFTRLQKLKRILDATVFQSMIVGVLPPGNTITVMLSELKKRLFARCFLSDEDVQKKLSDAEQRIIPLVLQEADIIIRSEGNHSDSDAGIVMKKWKEMME